MNIRAIASVLVLGLIVFWVGTSGILRSPEAAMSEFLAPNREVGEDQLTDPLIPTGSRAVPLVVSRIADRNLPYRRYALGYLGWAGDARALPALIRIVEDTTELSYFRGDALEAIACTRVGLGDSLASRFVHDTGFLGATASQVFDGPFCPPEGRSFWDALVGQHE